MVDRRVGILRLYRADGFGGGPDPLLRGPRGGRDGARAAVTRWQMSILNQE